MSIIFICSCLQSLTENGNFLSFRNRYGTVKGRATNNIGEIQAATHAIELAGEHGIQHLCIKTDSHYLLSAVRHSMHNWIRNSWTESDGYPVENESDFRRLDWMMNRYSIQLKWEHVAAHSGIFGNECADRLARRGAETHGA